MALSVAKSETALATVLRSTLETITTQGHDYIWIGIVPAMLEMIRAKKGSLDENGVPYALQLRDYVNLSFTLSGFDETQKVEKGNIQSMENAARLDSTAFRQAVRLAVMAAMLQDKKKLTVTKKDGHLTAHYCEVYFDQEEYAGLKVPAHLTIGRLVKIFGHYFPGVPKPKPVTLEAELIAKSVAEKAKAAPATATAYSAVVDAVPNVALFAAINGDPGRFLDGLLNAYKAPNASVTFNTEELIAKVRAVAMASGDLIAAVDAINAKEKSRGKATKGQIAAARKASEERIQAEIKSAA